MVEAVSQQPVDYYSSTNLSPVVSVLLVVLRVHSPKDVWEIQEVVLIAV